MTTHICGNPSFDMLVCRGCHPEAPALPESEKFYRPQPKFPYVPGQRCTIPPKGWECTRKAPHDGPCAAVPKVDRVQFGIIFRLASLWLGVHWSKTNRRLCINLLPCVTIYITLPGGDLPKTPDYPHRFAIR